MPVDFDLENGDVNALITREVIWVTILDKYDAHRRRGKGDHAQAIEWLYQYVREDTGGGLAKISDAKQREVLRNRFLDAISLLDQGLAARKPVRKAA